MDDGLQFLKVSSNVAPFVSQVITHNIYKTHYQLAICVLCSQVELIPVGPVLVGNNTMQHRVKA